jgi:parallel beta-helix repeat protein
VAGTDNMGTVDGNGVELDQWSNNNTVSGNTICGNDGSGIAVYDSWGNSISDNMVFCNDAEPTKSPGANGEISLASSLGLTSDNDISGNTLLGISPYAPVALVDSASTTLGNIFAGNMLEDFGAMAMYDWGNVLGGNASVWRSVTGGSDWMGGMMPATDVGNNGVAYDFDAVTLSSPLAPNFRFPWQTDGAYGA